MFDNFANDSVTVRRDDGTLVREGVRADVQTGMIFIDDASVQIGPGYEISRVLPNGLTETYEVIEPGFYQASLGIEAHYQVKVRRKGSAPRSPSTITYNVTGPNAKVNIGSYDRSHNVVYHSGGSDELFANIRSAIEEGMPDAEHRESALDAVRGMEAAAGTASFVEHYTRFVSVIADHITLIAPFIPALTQLIPQ